MSRVSDMQIEIERGELIKAERELNKEDGKHPVYSVSVTKTSKQPEIWFLECEIQNVYGLEHDKDVLSWYTEEQFHTVDKFIRYIRSNSDAIGLTDEQVDAIVKEATMLNPGQEDCLVKQNPNQGIKR